MDADDAAELDVGRRGRPRDQRDRRAPRRDRRREPRDRLGHEVDDLLLGDDADVVVGDERQRPAPAALVAVEDDRPGLGDRDRAAGERGVDARRARARRGASSATSSTPGGSQAASSRGGNATRRSPSERHSSPATAATPAGSASVTSAPYSSRRCAQPVAQHDGIAVAGAAVGALDGRRPRGARRRARRAAPRGSRARICSRAALIARAAPATATSRGSSGRAAAGCRARSSSRRALRGAA